MGHIAASLEEKTRNGILSTLTPLGEFGARILVPRGVGLFKVDFSRDNSCHTTEPQRLIFNASASDERGMVRPTP